MAPIAELRGAADGTSSAAGPSWRGAFLRVLFVAIVGLVAVAGTAWWQAHRPVQVHYMTVPVSRGTLSRAATATATVNPVLTIIVGTYVSGAIQDLDCDFNTHGSTRASCARRSTLARNQSLVNQARADLANAKAQIVKDRASLAYAGLSFKRDGSSHTISLGSWTSA